MKIAKAVRELAIKHKITVARNHAGVYTIGTGRWPLTAQTTGGALNRLRWLIKNS